MGQLPLAPVNGGGASGSEDAGSRPDDGLPHAESHHPESRGGHTGGISEEAPEGYRRKFREERFSPEEHPRTLAHRLNEDARGWLRPDATTKARLVEVIVVERFLECLAPEPRLWVQRQAPATLDQAVALAEQYQAAEPTPARLPERSTMGSSAPPAPDRAMGLGEGVYKVLDGGGCGSSRPGDRGSVEFPAGCCGVLRCRTGVSHGVLTVGPL
ncbi:UNVERIFIED_CONTAM: hypothetical protein FKN15_068987 [Acipenser sinensis]